jgi:putative secretion ATPase (PEP-CTERM system associated)
MRCEGFIVITGEVGAGKTTIVRGLLDSLMPNSIVAAHLVSTQLGAEDTLRLVGAAFGVPVHGVSKSGLLLALEAYFIAQTLHGKRCLLIVDEAQNLQPQAVEELRMLSNFQNGKDALLQTFLVGQPEFREILQNANMLQLRQRVTAACHLGPLDAAETRSYILHRLKCAGAEGRPTFEEDVFGGIYDYTDGIPRRINGLCDRLLLQGFLDDSFIITKNIFISVLAEFQQEMDIPSMRHSEISAGITGESVVMPELENRLTRIGLDMGSALVQEIDGNFSKIAMEQLNARLSRIEHGVFQQEKMSAEILIELRRLVAILMDPTGHL